MIGVVLLVWGALLLVAAGVRMANGNGSSPTMGLIWGPVLVVGGWMALTLRPPFPAWAWLGFALPFVFGLYLLTVVLDTSETTGSRIFALVVGTLSVLVGLYGLLRELRDRTAERRDASGRRSRSRD